jgi:hypothetical protein
MPGFIRWIGASALIGKAQMPFEAFLLGQMAPIHAFDVIFPFSGSHLIGNAFIGWGGVFLILLSLNRLKQTPILQPLLFLMIWGFLSAFGSNFGLAYINYHIPFLNLMREPGRHLFIFIFSASVLLTHGLDYLVTNRKESLRFFLTRYNLTAFCVLCLITILGPLLFSVKAPAAYIGITALIAAAFPVYLLCRSPRTRMLVLVALSAAMISTGLSYFNFIRIPITEGDYFDRWNLTSHNVLRDLSGIEGIKDYRVIFQEPGKDQYWSMNGSYYGIRSFNAYFNPLPHEQFSQIFYHGHRYDNYRELLGAKYVVCKTCDASSLKAYTLEQELHGYNIFRTDNVLPRYKVFNILESTYQNSTQFYQHLASGYDFVNRLQIRESDAAKLKEHLVSNAGEVTPCVLKEERSSFNSLTLSASCDSPGVLVLNEYFNSNWKARINSNDAELFRVNLNQIGIPLGKGASFVEIEYRPRLFSLLRCFSSAVAWGLLVAFLLTLAVRRGWISRS